MRILLSPVEKIVNHALQENPTLRKKLRDIENKSVLVRCDDFNFSVCILIQQEKIYFRTTDDKTICDATLSGTLSHFIFLMIKGVNTATLTRYPIEMRGNIHSVDLLRDVIMQLQIDWEEKLSHYVGDVIAHRVCALAQNACDASSRAAENLKMQMQEYVHFELKALPTRKQLEVFYSDVDKLRDDVERLFARYQSY